MGYIKLFSNAIAYQDYMNGDPLLPNVSLIEENEGIFYTPKEVSSEYENEYLYLEALEDGMTVSFDKKATSGSLYYSLDKQGWSEFTESQTINTGEKIYFKGDLVLASSGIGTFAINKQCNVAGNVMSLLFADDFVGKTDLTGYNKVFRSLFNHCITIQSAENLILPAITLSEGCYWQMFQDCTGLTIAPELPATTLAVACYNSMFYNCTSLTTTPSILPATTLSMFCYQAMFIRCTSLTSAPELPATTLANYCYGNMFFGCTGLTSAPELPATTLADYCYQSMFNGCSSLTSTPKLPATTLANNCYQAMFQYCTSLTTAPELPATTLAYNCYSNMFDGCTKLNNITMLATDISASYCLSYWVANVASTGTFVKAEGVEIPTGSSGIPEGWSVQVA